MEDEISAVIDIIVNLIDQGIQNSTLTPEVERFFKWEFENFKYERKGIEPSPARGKEFTKPVWFKASDKVNQQVQKSVEYRNLRKSLQEHFPNKVDIDWVLGKIIRMYFDHKDNRSAFNREKIVRRLIDDLNDKPAMYTAVVQFQGIILESERIEIPEIGLVLRQPIREDIEQEIPYSYLPILSGDPIPHVSAVGEISLLGHGLNDVHGSVEKATALLRLFKIGSVMYTSRSISTDSLADMFTGRSPGMAHMPLEKYYIETREDEKLKSFIRRVSPLLPQKIYMLSSGEVSHLSIAFDRYSDSLLRIGGSLEERIANAVMGLEALLIDENLELSYKLRLRVAKVLSFLGGEAKRIRDIIKDVYRVRSLFAHGAQLSPSERRKYETKYGSLENLLRATIDYLRKIIVALMLYQRSKDEFLFLIDDSFIDKNAEAQLANALTSSKEIL